MHDLISRQFLMECVNEGWIKFDTEKDESRFIHLVRDIAPSEQPEPIKINIEDFNKEDWERLKKELENAPITVLPEQPEQQWIPCSERLPKPYEYCLWTTTDGRVIYHHCDGLFSNYTAWMPLPEPYKEERREE